MEKLSKHVSIREFAIKKPVVFIANIPTTHYKMVGDTYYQPIMNNFK